VTPLTAPPQQPPAPPASPPPGGRPPHRPRHRVLTLLIVVLLIAIPGGYLVHSAFISRAAGKDSQRKSAATDISYGWPARTERRIYDVPVPAGASRVAFYESNSWKKNALYVQFRTTPQRLRQFLADAGTGPSQLQSGRVTIGPGRAQAVGWDLAQEGHRYEGLTRRQPGARPDLAVTVDTTYKARPRVYVLSRAEF
jgi:hypothetical protein